MASINATNACVKHRTVGQYWNFWPTSSSSWAVGEFDYVVAQGRNPPHSFVKQPAHKSRRYCKKRCFNQSIFNICTNCLLIDCFFLPVSGCQALFYSVVCWGGSRFCDHLKKNSCWKKGGSVCHCVWEGDNPGVISQFRKSRHLHSSVCHCGSSLAAGRSCISSLVVTTATPWQVS